MLKKLNTLKLIVAIGVITTAILVLTGWVFNVQVIKQPLPQSGITNPMVALAAIFCGSALLIISGESKSSYPVRMGQGLSFLVILVSSLKLLACFYSYKFNVDSWIFAGEINTESSFSDGKTALIPINTAIAFLLIGV